MHTHATIIILAAYPKYARNVFTAGMYHVGGQHRAYRKALISGKTRDSNKCYLIYCTLLYILYVMKEHD